MNRAEEILKLVKENPELPIIPMVGTEVVADDCSTYWVGSWGRSEINEIYYGRERIHFKDDDEEESLTDMIGCRYGETKDGRDIWELADEEWEELYESLPWKKVIVAYIETPDE